MASFKANGKEYELPTDLTIGEMCDAEQHFGIEFGNTDKSSMRLGAALVWIALQRDDPTVKPEDVRGLPLSLFQDVAGDASPPAVRPVELSSISGGSSDQPSGIPDDPRGSGSPSSDTGSDSARATFFSALQAS